MYLKAKYQPRCKWISWDEEGRPSCEHGPAIKSGGWKCGMKRRAAGRRYKKKNPEKIRAQNEIYNKRRVRRGDFYYGMAQTAEQAAQVNQHLAVRIVDHRLQQREEYLEARDSDFAPRSSGNMRLAEAVLGSSNPKEE